ncbi:MAG TPA: ANTAR domain-containing protein [Pseudonocardia sp.]|nr:ANTAR domain-containing protein [Pseudonocardia sp.]
MVEQVRFGERLLVLLMESLSSALPRCSGIGLSLCARPGSGRAAAGIGLAVELDAAQWAAGEGPLPEAAEGEAPVSTPDLGTDRRWPTLPRPASCAGLAVVAVPGGWDEHGPVVLSAYLAEAPGPAELAVIDRFEPLLATGLGVVEYCTDELVKADEMIGMMHRRRAIERAKGVVMGRAGVDSEQAFAMLVAAAQRAGIPVRELALDLLAHAGGGTCGRADGVATAAGTLWAELTAADA